MKNYSLQTYKGLPVMSARTVATNVPLSIMWMKKTYLCIRQSEDVTTKAVVGITILTSNTFRIIPNAVPPMHT